MKEVVGRLLLPFPDQVGFPDGEPLHLADLVEMRRWLDENHASDVKWRSKVPKWLIEEILAKFPAI